MKAPQEGAPALDRGHGTLIAFKDCFRCHTYANKPNATHSSRSKHAFGPLDKFAVDPYYQMARNNYFLNK